MVTKRKQSRPRTPRCVHYFKTFKLKGLKKMMFAEKEIG